MANPEVLQQSLARTRQDREDYEQAARDAGIKDVRRPANTPGNRVSFADGATVKPGMLPINRNPRFAPRVPDTPAPDPTPTPVPGAKTNARTRKK